MYVVSFSPGDSTFVLRMSLSLSYTVPLKHFSVLKILLSLFWIVLFHMCDLWSNCRTVMCFKYLELLGRRGGSFEHIHCSSRRLGLDSHTHTVTHNCLTLVQGIQCPLLTSTSTRHACAAHAYMQPNTHTHNVK